MSRVEIGDPFQLGFRSVYSDNRGSWIRDERQQPSGSIFIDRAVRLCVEHGTGVEPAGV